MAETIDKRRPWWRWLVLGLLVLLALVLLAVVGGYLYLRSGAGLRFVESQVEGRELGPLAGVEIDGLDGNLFDAVTIDELRIKDPEGTWLILRDVAVDYTLLSIRDRHIDIDLASAREIEALRRPTLLETEDTGGEPFRTTVERFSAERIILREPVLGQPAELTAEGTFAFRKDGSIDLDLLADRLDAPGESLALDFARGANGDLSGDFTVEAAADGPIATLMRAPAGEDVSGEGTVNGTVESGTGDLTLRFGSQQVVDATANWTPGGATASGQIEVGAWPAFDAVSTRTGDTLDFDAQLDRTTQAFTADIDSPDLEFTASGTLPEAGGLPSEADIRLVSATPTKLLSLPEGYALGSLRAEGRATLPTETTNLGFDGTASLTAVDTPFFSAGTINSPLVLTQNADGTYDIRTDTRLGALITKQALPLDLASTATVDAVLRLNPETQRVRISTFALQSGNQSVTASGTATYGDTVTYDLAGRADVRLNAIGTAPAGRVTTDYALTSTGGLPAVSAEGAFLPTGDVAPPLGDLLGDRLAFDVDAQPLEGGAIRIDNALFASKTLRAAVSGTVGDTLDIDGEANVLGTLDLGQAVVGEGAQASFTVTGTREAPNLRLDASLPTLTAAGRDLQDVRVRADVTDLLTNPHGPVQVEADTEYGPLVASANLASENGLYAATDISVNLDGISAGGDLRVVQGDLYSGRIALDLPREGESFANAVLILEPRAGEQGVTLDVDAENVSVAGYDIAYIKADANGTLASLTGDIELRGRENTLISQPFELDAPFTVTSVDGVYRATLSPEGRVEGIRFAAGQPITATYSDGNISLDGRMSINDGAVAVKYARDGSAETLEASLDSLPLGIFPLPVGLGETQGELVGELAFRSGQGTATTGTFNVALQDWRGRLAEPGDGITLTTVGTLEPGALRLRLDDGGRTAYDIQGQARIPLSQADTLTGLRPLMDAPVTGRFQAGGDARVIFDLVAPEDSDPRGTVAVDVALRGTLANPNLNGTATGAGLGFEAPVAGTRIRDGRFSADFTASSVTITDVFANDTKDGTLTGGGEFRLADGNVLGQLELALDGFKALDRRDYEARLDGTVGYRSSAEAQTVIGDILITKAEVKQINPGVARVVELVVDEEIGTRSNTDRISVPRTLVPVALDMRVRAPREIFIRARGIELEAQLDITVKGTVTEPLIYGSAEVIRGGITLAGRELEFDEGVVTFNGPIPDSRVNLEAEAVTPTLTARVAVTGTVEAPEIKLSSTPERPEDEILSALLFGRSATQLSALEAAQLAGALATLSGGGGGFNLVGGLRDALGFSSLDIGVGEGGTASFSGGRYLARDVYLELFSGTETSATGARISWEVRPNVILRTQLASDNEQAFAVLYERDF